MPKTTKPKQTPLCADCAKKGVACVIGSCSDCGGFTPYRAYKKCAACAEKQGVCAMCLTPMKKAPKKK